MLTIEGSTTGNVLIENAGEVVLPEGIVTLGGGTATDTLEVPRVQVSPGGDAGLARFTVFPMVATPPMTLLGDRVMVKVGAFAFPFSLTTCGEYEELSVIVRVPDRMPAAMGAKTTSIPQLDPAASAPPQVLVCIKSLLVVIPVKTRLAELMFVRVTCEGGLFLPVVWSLKVTIFGETRAVF
jgi:hypothetical protein